MNDFMYECVLKKENGNEYHLSHQWTQLRTFFGFIHAYQCENCKITMSKKKFIDGNYRLYDKISHY